MVDTLIIAILVLSAAAQVLLMLIAVYFAVRTARAVGTFWAWIFVVAAFAMLTLRNVLSLVLTLSLPPDQLGALIEQLGPVSVWPSQVISLAGTVLLVLGLYGIERVFAKPGKAQDDASKARWNPRDEES